METGWDRVGALVGRDHELRQLEAEFQLASKGTPRVAIIEGPPGIGKSSLVREFLDRAGAAAVVHARGDEAETHLPRGLADQLLRKRDDSGNGKRRASDVPGDSMVIGGELLNLLADLEATGLVVVIVDDAHWADPQSLQALGFALRRLHSDRVLALVVVRDVDTELPQGLRRLAEERGKILRLEGLGATEMGEIAALLGVRSLPRRALTRLVEHTEGNPLHARALLEELPWEVLVGGAGRLPAPRSFRLLVVGRLAGLSEEARRLVEAAAVLGQESDLRLVCGVAGVDQPRRAIDEAIEASLLDLRNTPTSTVARFPHSMIRAAVYDNLRQDRRCTLHARAAFLVDGSRSLPHRAASTIVPDSALAGELARQGVGEAARGALSTAAHYTLLAARLTSTPEKRHRWLLDAVEYLLAAGEVEEAAVLAQHLNDLPESARRRYVLGHLAFLAGRQKEAEEHLRGAWEQADPQTESDVRALTSEQLAAVYAQQIRPTEAIAWGRRAVEASPSPTVDSPALTTLVVFLALVGKPGEAMPLVEALPERSSELSPREAAGVFGRGIVRMWMGDLERAHWDLNAVVEKYGASLTSSTGLTALRFLAHVEYLIGNWTESIRHAELAVELAEDTGQAWLSPVVHATASRPFAARGDWAVAEAHVNAAQEAARILGDAASIASADDAEIHLAFRRRDHEWVVEVAQRLQRQPGRALVDEPGVFSWTELYAETLLEIGQLDEAAAVLEDLERRLAERPRRRLAHAAAARVRGSLEAARSNDSAARCSFEKALSSPEMISAPFERAQTEEAYGRFLRRFGHRREAAARLQEALDAYTALGANSCLERAQRELGALGRAPRRREVVVPVGLTSQEMVVAELAAEGYTNREIAAKLVVTPKTVEYHLRNIFTKLGISSRRELRSSPRESRGRLART